MVCLDFFFFLKNRPVLWLSLYRSVATTVIKPYNTTEERKEMQDTHVVTHSSARRHFSLFQFSSLVDVFAALPGVYFVRLKVDGNSSMRRQLNDKNKTTKQMRKRGQQPTLKIEKKGTQKGDQGDRVYTECLVKEMSGRTGVSSVFVVVVFLFSFSSLLDLCVVAALKKAKTLIPVQRKKKTVCTVYE